jgi:ribosomal protein L24
MATSNVHAHFLADGCDDPDAGDAHPGWPYCELKCAIFAAPTAEAPPHFCLPGRRPSNPPTPVPLTISLCSSSLSQGPGKKWESYDLTANGKAVRIKMHIKKGDTVKVIAGSDKGKVGKIAKVNTKTGEVLIDGINLKVRHTTKYFTDRGGSGGTERRRCPPAASDLLVVEKGEDRTSWTLCLF